MRSGPNSSSRTCGSRPSSSTLRAWSCSIRSCCWARATSSRCATSVSSRSSRGQVVDRGPACGDPGVLLAARDLRGVPLGARAAPARPRAPREPAGYPPGPPRRRAAWRIRAASRASARSRAARSFAAARSRDSRATREGARALLARPQREPGLRLPGARGGGQRRGRVAFRRRPRDRVLGLSAGSPGPRRGAPRARPARPARPRALAWRAPGWPRTRSASALAARAVAPRWPSCSATAASAASDSLSRSRVCVEAGLRPAGPRRAPRRARSGLARSGRPPLSERPCASSSADCRCSTLGADADPPQARCAPRRSPTRVTTMISGCSATSARACARSSTTTTPASRWCTPAAAERAAVRDRVAQTAPGGSVSPRGSRRRCRGAGPPTTSSRGRRPRRAGGASRRRRRRRSRPRRRRLRSPGRRRSRPRSRARCSASRRATRAVRTSSAASSAPAPSLRTRLISSASIRALHVARSRSAALLLLDQLGHRGRGAFDVVGGLLVLRVQALLALLDADDAASRGRRTRGVASLPRRSVCGERLAGAGRSRPASPRPGCGARRPGRRAGPGPRGGRRRRAAAWRPRVSAVLESSSASACARGHGRLERRARPARPRRRARASAARARARPEPRGRRGRCPWCARAPARPSSRTRSAASVARAAQPLAQATTAGTRRRSPRVSAGAASAASRSRVARCVAGSGERLLDLLLPRAQGALVGDLLLERRGQLREVVGEQPRRASRRSAWTTCALRATSACRPSGPSWRRISRGQVAEPREVGLHRVELAERLLLALAVLEDAGGLLDEAAPLLGGRAQHRVELALADDDVHLAAEAGVGEQVLDVEQPARADPLIAYSEPPLRNSVREIVTSEYSIGRAPSVLSIVSETSARPSGGRPEVPAKMTSSILPPRSVLAPCSPITQASASTTLDLPEPLGPTTQVTPGLEAQGRRRGERLEPPQGQGLEVHGSEPSAVAAPAVGPTVPPG